MLDFLAAARRGVLLILTIALSLISIGVTILVDVSVFGWLFLILGLILLVFVLVLIGVGKHRRKRITRLLKVEFLDVVGIAGNEVDPYVDFIFKVRNDSGYSVTINGIREWIEINEIPCTTSPQITLQYFRRDTEHNEHNIRIHQPITTKIATMITGNESSFSFSNCKLIVDSGDEISLGGPYSKVPKMH